MARWETGANERLQQSALELFARHGFDGVTTARIAESAGLTERTFFRYFADKREVLFAGQEEFAGHFLRALDDAASADPLDRISAALAGAAAFFPDERRQWSRARGRIIDSEPRLREREMLKLTALTASLTAALGDRGLTPTTAAVTAQTIVSVFHLAFGQWIAPGEERPFADIARAVLAEFQAVVAR